MTRQEASLLGSAREMEDDLKLKKIKALPPSGKKLVRSNSQIITKLFQVSSENADIQRMGNEKPAVKKPLSRTTSTFAIISGKSVTIPPKAAAVIGASSHDACAPQVNTPGTPKIRIPSKQKNLASLVQKHFIKPNVHNKLRSQGHNADLLSSDNEAVGSLSKSCPNLINKMEQNTKSKVRITRSIDTAFDRRQTRSPTSSDSAPSPKLLRVPDVFTTSQTHSVPTNDTREANKGHEKEYRYSAPELREGDITHDSELTRSLSNPRERSKDLDRDRNSYYNDANISQMLDFLFVGNVDSAYHERLLCRLNIEGIIDVSSVSPDDIPAHKKRECPCMCPLDKRHLRPKLRIDLRSTEGEDMFLCFDEINRFLEGFRKTGKRVLVHCIDGKCQAPATVMQYIMTYRNLNLRRSFNLVKKLRPEVELNETFHIILKRLERRLRQRGCLFYPPQSPGTDRSNPEIHTRRSKESHRKVAWSEC